MSVFANSEAENLRRAQPLAARMRPATLDEFVGQEHFLGEDKLLRRLLSADRLGSVIFYGPPGCGKTTLLRLIAGFEKPTKGWISIDSQIVATPQSIHPPEKRNVGMVFQDYVLFQV